MTGVDEAFGVAADAFFSLMTAALVTALTFVPMFMALSPGLETDFLLLMEVSQCHAAYCACAL